MTRMRAFALLGLMLLLPPLQAAEPVHMAGEVAYRDGVGSAAMRAECTWTTRLAEQIAKKSRGSVVISQEPLDGRQGATLHLEVVSAHATGGGMMAGPKWASIRGELRSPGAEPRTLEIRRSTTKGFTACKAMERVADALAADVLVWLRNPAAFPAAPEPAQ